MSNLENKRNMEWGLLLIAFGAAALIGSMNLGTEWLQVGIMALGGLVGLVVYLLDRTDWVLLIPPYIMLVAAGISALAILGYADGELFASFVMLMIALPFLVVFLRDRKNWWALIPAWVLLAIGAIIAVEELNWLGDAWTGSLILGSIGLPFLVVYLIDRKNWWALIPAWILLTLAVIIAVEELGLLGGSWIASLILGSIALPFLLVFLLDRKNWWALIPFYVLVSLAVMIPLIENQVLNEGWIATFILGSVGLPFLVVFFYDRKQWWALIPAYVMLVLGLMIGLITENVLVGLVIPSYIMFSIAAPFFVVFLLDRKQGWALIPGSIVGVMGLLFLIGTEFFQYVFPAALILLGLWVLLRVGKKQE